MNSGGMPRMSAAGGLVLCGGHALLIRKHGLWDIPKGKRKRGEDPKLCAVREIAEETGLAPERLSIRRRLFSSGYVSYYSGKPFHKTVDWFALDYGGALTDPLQPDLSEDIDLCRWVAVDDLLETLETARPYLRPVRARLAPLLEALRSGGAPAPRNAL